MTRARRTTKSIRWGDQQERTVAIGDIVNTNELVRVEAPFPCVWRVLAIAVFGAANALLVTTLRMQLGVGSFVVGPVNINVTPGQLVSFEIPAQIISLRFSTDAALAADHFIFGAMVAPTIPWEGLSVNVISGQVLGDDDVGRQGNWE